MKTYQDENENFTGLIHGCVIKRKDVQIICGEWQHAVQVRRTKSVHATAAKARALGPRKSSGNVTKVIWSIEMPLSRRVTWIRWIAFFIRSLRSEMWSGKLSSHLSMILARLWGHVLVIESFTNRIATVYIPSQYWLYSFNCAVRLFCLHCSMMSIWSVFKSFLVWLHTK